MYLKIETNDGSTKISNTEATATKTFSLRLQTFKIKTKNTAKLVEV